MKSLHLVSALAGVALVALAAPASAEMAISVYGGVQGAPHSRVDISGTNSANFRAGWEGKSFAMPPYYGVRGTWWLDGLNMPDFGIAIDYSHTKLYADQATLTANSLQHFEFTDGLNLLTANAFYRFRNVVPAVTPYVGVGAGVSIPHVELNWAHGNTSEFQYGGPTVQGTVGASYDLSDNWSVFAEYKVNYSWVKASVDNGANTLKTNVLTNALNVGVSYKF